MNVATALCDLATKHGTDKGPIRHNYTQYYFKKLDSIREQVKLVLEIGIASGASIKMWLEYFPNLVKIVGVDKNPECRTVVTDERFVPIIGEQGINNTITNMCKMNYDLIIDDGSHRAEDQQTCFSRMFAKNLQPGGLYVIEDLQTYRETKIEETKVVLKRMMATGKYEGQCFGGSIRTKQEYRDRTDRCIKKVNMFDDKIAFIHRNEERV